MIGLKSAEASRLVLPLAPNGLSMPAIAQIINDWPTLTEYLERVYHPGWEAKNPAIAKADRENHETLLHALKNPAAETEYKWLRATLRVGYFENN